MRRIKKLKKMRKNNFRFIYTCPKCGRILLKAEEYSEKKAKVKCERCKTTFYIDDLPMKKLFIGQKVYV